MTIHYLFIDDDVGVGDDKDADAAAYARRLESASKSGLKINPRAPGGLSEVLQLIHAEHGNGLLLDVSFINATSGTGGPPEYDGIALAQQIRTLQTRGQLASFPIVRLSKRDVVREYVAGDTSSDDLFDERVEKEDVLDQREVVAKKLESLATDYPVLAKFAAGNRTAEDIALVFGVTQEFLERLDSRSLLGLTRDAPTHTLTQYLISNFIRKPGVLMDADLLAVRLGIDRQKSEDWSAVLGSLEGLAYRGAFAHGYPRYWATSLTDWWDEKSGIPTPLRRTDAATRVGAIQQLLGVQKLSPIEPTADSPGTRPWHICVESGVPVDPSEGFPLMDEWGHEPWQDTDYISLEVARRKARTHKRLRSADKARALKARADA